MGTNNRFRLVIKTFIYSKFKLILLLSILSMLSFQITTSRASNNCNEGPGSNNPGLTFRWSCGDPTFIQMDRRTKGDNFIRKRLEVNANSSNDALFGYEKSIIKGSPQLQITSELPDWLDITISDEIDLNDEKLKFIKLTIEIGSTPPNSSTDLKLRLIDTADNKTKLTTILKVTVDRNLVAEIAVPVSGSLVRGNVPIFGLAYGEDFSSYTVEYGRGYEPSEWTIITTSSTPQVTYTSRYSSQIIEGNLTVYGNLATWETGLTEYSYGYWSVDLNGVYTVRLKVTNTSGQIASDEVTVQVGQVMGSSYSGHAISPDGKVLLWVQEQSVKSDFIVVGIDSVLSDDVIIDPTYNLIGHIYELRPPALEFTKSATLEISYTDEDLGDKEKTKLGIYTYNPLTGYWDYIPGTIDLENNKIIAPIRSITSEYAYYAILEKAFIPNKPVLDQLPSPTQQKNVTVSGTADRNAIVEIFVNGFSQGITTANNIGTFTFERVVLEDGINTIVTKVQDQFGQQGPESEPITIEVIEPQIIVTSLSFKTSNYLSDFTGTVDVSDVLYMELVGRDSNPDIRDMTSVLLASSISDSEGIEVQLIETGPSTGTYRGEATIGLNSSRSSYVIAAYHDGETITATSKLDNTISDSIMMSDNTPPQAPTITSTTHPSVCQNTFEDGFGWWQNRDGQVGATLYLNKTESLDGNNCLELVNLEYGGNFASTAINTAFNAQNYPIVTFDYKTPEEVKINLLVRVDDFWYDVVFTDDPKLYWLPNMQKLGQIEDVVADNKWRTASFNLFDMLKTVTGNFTVQEVVMADWDNEGFMKLTYGTNSAYATYYIDNFKILSRGFANSNPRFAIDAPEDCSGITEYSYLLDQIPDTIPDTVAEGTEGVVNYTDVADGIWYFHARAKDGAGNWGSANHYQIRIDTEGPVADLPRPVPFTTSGDPAITLHLTDDEGVGVDPYTIRLKVGDIEYDLWSPALSYDERSEVLTFDPSAVDIIWPNGQVMNVELIQAKDYVNNTLRSTLKWEWVLDYSLDSTPPTAPTIISPVGHNSSCNKVTFMWVSSDENGIADYSFLLDQDESTVPDMTGKGLITSKTYYDLDNSTYYFHVRAKDRAGNWSEATHYQISIDTDSASIKMDDFNDGSDPNEFGGYSYTFENPEEGGTCLAKYYNENLSNVYGEEGYSLQLIYDVSSDRNYAGYCSDLNSIDLSHYNALTFWIKSTEGQDVLRVGLRDPWWNESKVFVSHYLSKGVTTTWQKVVIPLVAFTNISNWSDIELFSITFESWFGSTSGTIYLDEIRFEEKAEPIIIDTFNSGYPPNSVGRDMQTLCSGIASISTGYTSNNTYNNSTYSYFISYNGVTSSDWCFWSTGLNNLDASNFNTLSLYMKGAKGGEKPNIYLKDQPGNRKGVNVEKYKEVSTSWQRVNIPILDFIRQGLDITNLSELQVVFEWREMSGTIYVDDIQFTNADYPEVPRLDPIPTLTNQSQLTIRGTTTPGQEVIPVVEVPGIGIWEQEKVMAGLDGTFSAAVNLYGNGVRQLYVYTKDSDGNCSQNSGVQTLILDQIPPSVPTISEIESPRRESEITISGSAESSSTVYIKLTQPDFDEAKYEVQAKYGCYSINILLDDGDGSYKISASSKDPSGNLSAESQPVEVILDAISEPPVVTVISPKGKETVASGIYNILWEAADIDPTDLIGDISLRYTEDTNQCLVDDFNDGDEINCLGGSSGCWVENGAILQVSANADPITTYRHIGLSYRLDFNVSQEDSYCAYWTDLTLKPDMSLYSHISLLFRGAVGGETFKIGLKDSYFHKAQILVTDYLSTGVSTQWQKVTIPLNAFTDIDASSLDSFFLTFENGLGINSGALYIDEIRFIRWQDIALGEPNTGTYPWFTTTLPEANRYLIKVIAKDSRSLYGEDESDDYLSLATNLAKGRETLSSSQESSDYPSSNAVDGDHYSRWSSEFSDPQWIQIDLGEAKTINKVTLNWEAAYAKSYSIQVSDDATEWITVYSSTDGDGGLDEVFFADTTTRYIRMYGTERSLPYGYSLYEFEVYKVTLKGFITGTITLQGRTNHSQLITFELRELGKTNIIANSSNDEDPTTRGTQITTNEDGSYILTGIPRGIYDLTAKSFNTLKAKQENIEVKEVETLSNIDFYLLGGDADNDNIVSPKDFSILSSSYRSNPSSPNWDKRADFDNDNLISPKDFSILSGNYGISGEK